MKLRLEDITAEAREISFAEPETDVNRVLQQGPIADYRLEAAIQTTLTHYRAGTELFFEGMLSAVARATCARCAEEFDTIVERPFRFVLAPKSIGYDDKDLRSEDLEFSLYEGGEVDLTVLIREQLLLSLPTRPLCKDDCRGLCPRCGANLNNADCGHRAETFDPRLAALRSLKIQRS